MSYNSMTYSEIAERLGISLDGARMKVSRAKWQKLKGNDGKVRVLVPETAIGAPEPVEHAFPDHTTEHVRALEGHVVSLTQQVEHLQQQLGRAEATAASERERVADLTAQLLKVTGDMMGLQQAHQARPWWRRLAG